MSDDADVADYVNKKSTTSLSKSARETDKITNFAYFGHGHPDDMALGYNTIWDTFERLNSSSFNQSAFDENANIDLLSCRSGLGSLFNNFKKLTKGTIKGYNVRVHWGENYSEGERKEGIGVYMAWPKHPDNSKVVVPVDKRVRIERGTRK